MRLLWAIGHGLQRTSKRMDATLGITGPQRLVLKVVSRYPGVSPGELAHIVHLHPSTVTGIVQRLIDKRLLMRVPDPADSRRAHLSVRPAAGQYTRRSARTVEAAIEAALARIRPQQLSEARTVLSVIAASLNEASA